MKKTGGKTFLFLLQGSNSRRGFTLMEVLVALTILGMAVVVIIQLSSANSRSIMKTDAYTRSVLKADAKMSELLERGDLSEGQWTEQTQDGYVISYAIQETLAERTAELPLRMLHIDLSVVDASGAKNSAIRLRSMKLMKRTLREEISK